MKFKLITLNVLHGGVFIENILSFIKSEKPDMLFLQEMHNSKDKSLEKRFRSVDVYLQNFKDFLPYYAFEASAIHVGDIKKGIGWGNCVFSRYKIISSKSTFFDVPLGDYDFSLGPSPLKSPQILQSVTIDMEGKTIFGYNIHGIWGNDGDDNSRRINMARIVSSEMEGKMPAILAGDTNFDTSAKETVAIIEKNVKSVFEDSLKSTFNMRHKTNPKYAEASVDMVFASSELKVVNKYMPNVDVSDHMPLVVEFEI